MKLSFVETRTFLARQSWTWTHNASTSPVLGLYIGLCHHPWPLAFWLDPKFSSLSLHNLIYIRLGLLPLWTGLVNFSTTSRALVPPSPSDGLWVITVPRLPDRFHLLYYKSFPYSVAWLKTLGQVARHWEYVVEEVLHFMVYRKHSRMATGRDQDKFPVTCFLQYPLPTAPPLANNLLKC